MNTWQKRFIIASSVLVYMLIQPVQANPNHLEPIPPYELMDTGYHQAVFTSLIGDNWLPSLWMIERPSFSREYAVMLWCTVEYDPNDTRPPGRREIKRKQWVIEHVIPKDKIWRFKPVGDNREVPDIRPTEEVERRRTPIPGDFAKAVQEAWLNTLQLTRYAEDQTTGLDGTSLVRQRYFGSRFCGV